MGMSIRIAFVTIFIIASPVALAQSAADDLARGIDLFEEGRYAESQQVLLTIDPEKLTDEQRQTRDRYVDEVRLAVNLSNRAKQDFDEAQRALNSGDHARADVLFASVIRNEYAAEALKSAAVQGQAQVAAARAAGGADDAEPVAPQAPSRVIESTPPPQLTAQGGNDDVGDLIADGQEALRAGRNGDAARLFQSALDLDPGNPDAVAGLEAARQHDVVQQQSGSLIDRAMMGRNIQWQRTEATYRQLERQTMMAISDGQFDLARQLSIRARQVVESGRANAEPLSKYEALRSSADALVQHVSDEEAAYQAAEIENRRAAAADQEVERRMQVDDARQRQVDALFEQAMQLRQEKRYEESIQALQQITRIDPANERAAWMVDDLESLVDLEWQLRADKEVGRQRVRTFMDAEAARIPYNEEVMYPKNWPEITERRSRFGANLMSDSDLDRAARRRLEETLPEVSFTDAGLRSALESLREQNALNLHVNWPALASAGVTPDTPVSLDLKHVKLDKVLDLVLDNAGGTKTKLGYAVDDGVVTVSTKDDLNRLTTTRVYNVRDLLAVAPDFAAPDIEVGAARNASLTAHRTEERGPLFPQASDAATDLEGSEEPQPSPRHRAAVDDLMRIIAETVEPGTWRGFGGTVGSLRELNGQLIVTHTSIAQSQVGGLLGQLRQTRAVQIAVEARFLTIGSNYLEDLGVNFNVILNQGNAGYDIGQVTGPDGLPITAIDPATGSNVLIPREFSRLGFLPQPPAGTGGFNALNTFNQPYVQPGSVPRTGQVSPHSGQWSPVPIISNILSITDPAGLNTGVPGSFGGSQGLLQPALQVFGSFLDNIQVDFLLRATEADSRSSTLQAPRLTLTNGQRAFIGVVTQVSYVSGLNAVVAEEVGQLEPIVSTLNTGAVLDVEATVSADRRYVTLTVRAGLANLISLDTFEVNQPGTFSTGVGASIQIPVLSLTTVRSTVTVPDGGTLLLGGQKLTGEIENEGGVPVLSKIPVLKRLYTARSSIKDENVLLILIKPKIIIQSESEEDAFPGLLSAGG